MRNPRRRPSRYQAAVLAIGACIVFSPQAVTAKKPEPTDLADQPLRVTQAVPANVMLTLSVEWPTGNVQAYNDEVVNGCPGRDGGLSVCYFNPAERALRTNEFNGSNPLYKPKQSLPYIGYFDPYKCYAYNNASVEAERFFVPVGPTGGYVPTLKYTDQPVTSTATCSATWSGNFLNWATSQTIDIFRWSMTGGDRWIDTRTETVLEKARHDGQGGTQQFPEKRVGRAFGTIPVTPPSAVSPYTSSELKISIDNRNNRMTVTPNSGVGGGDFFVRVKVCDPAFPESVTVCTRYSPPGLEGADIDPASVVFKPTGLIQDNSMSVRFGAMGYLLDDAALRDGGVLRARMKFVGPEAPQTGGSGKRSNATAEWEAFTGIFIANPASLDADETNSGYGLSGNDRVTNSGVIQYLNKFGRRNGYKNHDPVSEMFYEGLRYFKNIGPTPEYSNMSLTGNTAVRKVDGFPVITNWDDPLAPPTGYLNVAAWCPKNFFVGISDANTHKDKRLPGNSSTQNESAAQPSNPDTSLDVVTLLNEIIASELSNEGVQLLKSDGSSLTSGPVNCCDGSAYLASLAYYANTRDVRPDAAAIQTKGKQSVRTYFVDVREAGSWGTGVARNDVKRRNQLWVASKYGGFRDVNGNGILDPGDAVVDENLDGTMNARDVWDRDGDLLPDTYFEAATPEAMISGLRTAFQSINAETAASAAVGISTRTVELQAGNGLYRVSYDPRSWSGSVVGLRYVDFDSASGKVSVESRWDAAEKIAAQHWTRDGASSR